MAEQYVLLVLITKSWGRQKYENLKNPRQCYAASATPVPLASDIMQNTFFNYDDENQSISQKFKAS